MSDTAKKMARLALLAFMIPATLVAAGCSQPAPPPPAPSAPPPMSPPPPPMVRG